MSQGPEASATENTSASKSDKLKFRLLGVVVLIALLACVAPFVVTQQHARLPKALQISAKAAPTVPAIAKAPTFTQSNQVAATKSNAMRTAQSVQSSQSSRPMLVALKHDKQVTAAQSQQNVVQAPSANTSTDLNTTATNANPTTITIQGSHPATITATTAPSAVQTTDNNAATVASASASASATADAAMHTSTATDGHPEAHVSVATRHPSQHAATVTTAPLSSLDVQTTAASTKATASATTSTVAAATAPNTVSVATPAPQSAPGFTPGSSQASPGTAASISTQPRAMAVPDDTTVATSSNASTTERSSTQTVSAPAASSLPSTLMHSATQASWLIQLGTFSKSTNAQVLQQRLQQAGYSVIVQHTLHRQGHDLWQVMVAADTRPSAQQLQKQLRARFALAGYIKKNPHS